MFAGFTAVPSGAGAEIILKNTDGSMSSCAVSIPVDANVLTLPDQNMVLIRRQQLTGTAIIISFILEIRQVRQHF